MARGRTTSDPATLAMALVGYELEKQKIDEKVRQIRAQLGGRVSGIATTNSASAKAAGTGPRRTLSASARKRIGAAQRKRWAEHRKKLAQSSKG
jgi:hypothetical protein